MNKVIQSVELRTYPPRRSGIVALIRNTYVYFDCYWIDHGKYIVSMISYEQGMKELQIILVSEL